MTAGRLLSLQYFPSLLDSEQTFKRLTEKIESGRRITSLYVLMFAFSFAYGIAMGSYHSPVQAMAAGVKVAALFTLALVICFPAFFIIQHILGSKLKLYQMVSIILSGFVLMTAIMLSFIPIVVIFLLTGSNYYFLQLLHIAIFVLAGAFGMKTVIDALKYSCEKANVYPHTGVIVFRFWVIILAFVGIQMAWNLRPFLGDRGEPFQLFRHYEGNFYTALIYSAEQLLNPPAQAPATGRPPDRTFTPDTTAPVDLFKVDSLGK